MKWLIDARAALRQVIGVWHLVPDGMGAEGVRRDRHAGNCPHSLGKALKRWASEVLNI